MTRWERIYGNYRDFREQSCKIHKNNSMNREGYGYIKRRVGLLSYEVGSPTYKALTELSDYINKHFPKS